MHLYFERNGNAKCDCNILSLSWMGKLPDELQENESWKLYRRKYYQEGWLATGNARGLVGVTFTTSHCRTRAPELPLRANYNLRGHRSEVILVKWNEPYQKLASCDSTGVIFVWIKYDGRWSIELINDRSTPVTHFSWSHDGRMALICYKDGFVLVGSVAGQRYWSSMLNHKAVITCGIWTPDDQQVYFGTTAGQLIVMDVHGAMVSEVQLGAGVTSMAWSAEKFKLEEDDDEEENEEDDRDDEDHEDDDDQQQQHHHQQDTNNNNNHSSRHNGNSSNSNAATARNYVLAVCLADGNVVLLRSFDDVSPVTICTGLRPPLHAEWSNSRKLLAIAGIKDHEQSHYYHQASNGQPTEYTNLLKFYSDAGILIYTIAIPYTQSPVTAMTWGHNDRRLFVATGAHVHAAWVSRGVGSLQLLSRLALKAALAKESSVQQLPLPPRLKALVSGLFASTIRCCIPEPSELRRFVSRPPPLGGRLHCTMLRNPGEPPHSYTLYVEYLGGLVPLLKGRRTSKIRPEFVIFDPESGQCNAQNGYELSGYASASLSPTSCSNNERSCSDDSDNERDAVELCGGSPRFRRKNRRKCRTSYERSGNCNNDDDDANYVDTLPENARLVEVTSNIWGTKFKFHGLADSVPANLGRVTYRPSLLHLQPRQMTLVITELRDDLPAGPDPTFNPNLFSEDEEESAQTEASAPQARGCVSARCPPADPSPQPPPIAPMTPRATRLSAAAVSRPKQQPPPPPMQPPTESRAEAAYDDDYSYDYHPSHHHHHQEHHPVVNYCDTMRASAPSAAGYHHHHHHHRPTYAPRCCDVPALQSPKNAVAPTQTLIATSSPSATLGEYASNVQRMKTALADQQSAISTLVRKELELNSSSKLMYAHSPPPPSAPITDEKYSLGGHPTTTGLIGTGSSSTAACCLQSATSARSTVATPLSHQGYPYVNGTDHSGSVNNSIVHSKNSLNAVSSRSEGQSTAAAATTVNAAKGVEENNANGPTSPLIDEEEQRNDVPALKNQFQLQAMHRTPTLVSIGPTQVSANSIVRSCSVGYLDLVDAQIVPCDVALNMLRKDAPNKRLFLVSSRKNKRRRRSSKDNTASKDGNGAVVHRTTRPRLSDCGKSRSLDSSELFPSTEHIIAIGPKLPEHKEEQISSSSSAATCKPDEEESNDAGGGGSEIAQNEINVRKEAAATAVSLEARQTELPLVSEPSVTAKPEAERAQFEPSCLSPIKGSSVSTSVASSLDGLASRLDGLAVKLGDYEDCHSLPPPSPRPTSRLPRSSPSSPAPSKKGKRPASASPIRRRLLSSPLLSRKSRKNRNESSDEEGLMGQDDISNYRDLETFQKAQLRQKLRQRGGNYGYESETTRREIIMHNKAPMWNEANQVYQLDFGGRVTQESAKNFQIEFRGNQVMQFGRIQGNAYTLDFQYPFSAIQAFAVALASVTQRLK